MEQPSFAQVRNDLVAHLYGFALAQDIILRDSASTHFLGVERGTGLSSWPEYEAFDLAPFQVANDLDDLYAYAFHGEMRAAVDDDSEFGNLGRLKAFLEMTASEHFSVNIEEARGQFDGEGEAKAVGLDEMVKRASARYALDEASHVSLADVALLADMSERSVRNALHAAGEAGLLASRSPTGELIVEHDEALRWLRGRRGFIETVWVGSGSLPDGALPERVAPDEVGTFIRKRMSELFPDLDNQAIHDNPDLPDAVKQAFPLKSPDAYGINRDLVARRLMWTQANVDRLLDLGVEAISPDDCPALSRLLRVDAKWLTAHVMRAKFPEAMSLIAPGRPVSRISASPLDEGENTLDVQLTDAGIRNGYIDLERRYADRLFPADCFGDRGAGRRGNPVTLRHAGPDSPYVTDLRVKSGALASPRKRFGSWFNAHKARPGDIIRIKRIDERTYELIHLQK